jgi:hypothetical protein
MHRALSDLSCFLLLFLHGSLFNPEDGGSIFFLNTGKLLAHYATSKKTALSRYKLKNNSTPWPQSESELYRPSDRRLSAKLVPTFADRMAPRGQRDGSLRPYSRLCRPDFEIHAV